MRIALINATKNEYLRPPLGILSLATYLLHKKAVTRKDICLMDVTLGGNLFTHLKDFKPDIIGLSFLSIAHKDTFQLAKQIKNTLPKAILIAGGIHISTMPELFRKPFDIGIIGEGEETLHELITHIQKNNRLNYQTLSQIKGIIYRTPKSNKNIRTGIRPPVFPLDKIPNIDWSLLPEGFLRKKIVFIEDKPKAVLASYSYFNRGCPFHCSFCTRPVFWGQLRKRSIESIANGIESLYKYHHVENIWLWDDTFIASSDELKKLIYILKRKKILGKVTFSALGTRTNMINEDLIKLYKKLGVIDLLIGFESGSEAILSQLKKNTTKVADTFKALDILEKYKINIWGSFIIGSPNETDNDMLLTLKLYREVIKRNNIIHAAVAVCTPLPKTDLWFEAFSKGIVSNSMDWRQMKSHNPTQRPTRLFFKEKISLKCFKYVWKETLKLRKELHNNHIHREGWTEALQEVIYYNKFADARIRWYFFKQSSVRRKILKIISLFRIHNIQKYGNLLLRITEKQLKKYFYRTDHLNSDLSSHDKQKLTSGYSIEAT